MTTPDQQALIDKNKRTGIAVLLFVFIMVGVSFAAVPLYDLFCRVTGFGGTTQVANALPAENQIIDRTVKINFNADTSQNMPWNFKPEMRSVNVKLGQRGLTSFLAENPLKIPITGTAIYNVTPLKAGKYFNKIQCFCFDEQTLMPNQSMSMPVMFFLDPEMHRDPDMDDVKTITLSYTFFKTETKELEDALEGFYNDDQTVITHIN